MSAIIRCLDVQNYLDTWQAMQDFTIKRYKETRDELWLVQHHPVYTLGLNGKVEHLLNTANIPVISSDRGGQVTYHGLGQVVIYTLLDIKRLGLNIRQLVSVLESAMIALLASYQIESYARADAPGVYVQGKKIGSIGIRIKNHCSYHGLSFNNDMDLTPFSGINPCGYQGLEVTQLKNLGVNVNTDVLALQLAELINTALACHALRDYHAKRDTPVYLNDALRSSAHPTD